MGTHLQTCISTHAHTHIYTSKNTTDTQHKFIQTPFITWFFHSPWIWTGSLSTAMMLTVPVAINPENLHVVGSRPRFILTNTLLGKLPLSVIFHSLHLSLSPFIYFLISLHFFDCFHVSLTHCIFPSLICPFYIYPAFLFCRIFHIYNKKLRCKQFVLKLFI